MIEGETAVNTSSSPTVLTLPQGKSFIGFIITAYSYYTNGFRFENHKFVFRNFYQFSFTF